jgi:hypothetical protein
LHRLRIVFCSDNPFTELPAVLGRCPSLEMIGFKANRIEHVPAESLPPTLRWLVLTDNRIEQLPSSIGQCPRLQKLMLAGNRLRALPPELAACRNLELRLSANALEAFPHWLLTLPRLSWLAMAGNPWCAAVEEAADRNASRGHRLGRPGLGRKAGGRRFRRDPRGTVDRGGQVAASGGEAVQGRGHQRWPARARDGGLHHGRQPSRADPRAGPVAWASASGAGPGDAVDRS